MSSDTETAQQAHNQQRVSMFPRNSSVNSASMRVPCPAPGPNQMRITCDDGKMPVRFTAKPGCIAVASEFANGARIGNFATDLYIEFPEYTDDDGNTVRRVKKNGDPISDKAVALRWGEITSFISQINKITFDEAQAALVALGDIDDEEEQRQALLVLFGLGCVGATYYATTDTYVKVAKDGREWDTLAIRAILSPEQYAAEVRKAEAARHSAATTGGKGGKTSHGNAPNTGNSAPPPGDEGDGEDIPF